MSNVALLIQLILPDPGRAVAWPSVTVTEPHPDAGLLQDLSARIDAGLRDALGGAREVALVNFPNHGNPGDPAIWLGELAALQRLGVRIRYQCAWCTYSPRALRRALPKHAPVLINGGGNFGDLYAGQQGLRERLLAELTDRRIIQLPQSIHFRDRANLDRVRKLVSDHGNVTLLVREQRSEEVARAEFDADVRLLPDMALALGPLQPPAVSPTTDVLWLHRLPGDPEYVEHGAPDPAVRSRTVEWLQAVDPEPAWPAPAARARARNEKLLPRCRDDARWAALAWRQLGATFAPLAEGYVRRGLAILGYGRVLVTDKLHGHLLALLAGIPHVVMDNAYGKVSGTYRTWTQPSTLAHWAEDGERAREIARQLLEDAPR